MMHQFPDLLHLGLHRSAKEMPDKIAVRTPDRSMSYSDLADQASRLAGALASQGIGRGDRVGVLLNRSVESAIAIYGILQTGAAYVPIDPGAPDARIKTMVAFCGLKGLVTIAGLRVDLREVLGSTECLLFGCAIDGRAHWTWDQVFEFDPAPVVAHRASELDVAFVMFTSGSTGEPKGMVHTHATAMAYLRMFLGLIDIGEDDLLGSSSPLHFDMSILDYFGSLHVGATTLIVPDPYLRMPASLADLISKERVTAWYTVPFSLVRLLELDNLEEVDLSHLRWVIYGGEVFAAAHLVRLTAALPNAKIGNAYGPAETNVCFWYEFRGPWTDERESAPIGEPCPCADILVLDPDGTPVNAGDTGELMVRTPTLMPGYFGRPDLNESAFLELPDETGLLQRYYRTGDLVRQREDGNFMFVGRKDRQIKTRGYRVELDEVEEALAACPTVTEAAVFAVAPSPTLTLIGAAVIARPNCKANPDEIIDFVAERLPSYACPVRVEILPDFPRTGSGKVDRRALAAGAKNWNFGLT